ARADTLVGIGFTLPALPKDELVALDQLDGVEAQYDASLQRIALSAPLSMLELETTRVGPSRDQILPASNAPGLLLNYDFYASHGDSSSNATAYGELRAFGLGTGVFSTSAVTRAYKATGSEWRGDS
ncbi:fimbrial biogenesis outer membrane usher protein, partial [Lysobacter sp. D1-1-M9]